MTNSTHWSGDQKMVRCRILLSSIKDRRDQAELSNLKVAVLADSIFFKSVTVKQP